MTNVKIAEKSPIVNWEAGVTIGEHRSLAAESSENTEIRQEFADRTAGGGSTHTEKTQAGTSVIGNAPDVIGLIGLYEKYVKGIVSANGKTMALCPFHADKNPSFQIFQKGGAKCYALPKRFSVSLFHFYSGIPLF